MRLREDDRRLVIEWMTRNPAVTEKVGSFPTDKLQGMLRSAEHARKDAAFRDKVRTESNRNSGRNVTKKQAVDLMWLTCAVAQLELEKRGALT